MSAPTAGRGPAVPRPTPREPVAEPEPGTLDGGSSLIRAARTFATRCHARQRRDSDGARFVEHPLEVARLLRGAGCSDVVVAAGLLHDVLETTSVDADELRVCFGAEVAALVCAVSEDPRVGSYRERKARLREQVRRAGGDAALLFAADKISKVRELDAAPRRGRTDTRSARDGHGEARSEHLRRLQIEHYHESLWMLRSVAPLHPLVDRLGDELADCPLAPAEPLPAGSRRGSVAADAVGRAL